MNIINQCKREKASFEIIIENFDFTADFLSKVLYNAFHMLVPLFPPAIYLFNLR